MCRGVPKAPWIHKVIRMRLRVPSVRRVMYFSIAVVAFGLVACGSDVNIDSTIDARVAQALANLPTATPQPTVTPQPTATPQSLPTSQTVPTPLPTSTPAPTATPQPTATLPAVPTPAPTVTPAPSATPQSSPTPAPVPSDLYSDLRLSIVKIRAGGFSGSGWAIENGWIITNEHVITGSTTVTIEVPQADGGVEVLVGTVRGFDAKRDLAAIQVEHEAPILPTRIVVASDAGTPIMQLGYSIASTGGFPVVHTGVVTTVVRHIGFVLDGGPQRADEGDDTGGVGVVVFDADADPGDSGGPVVDLQGNVVGITFGATVLTPGGKRVIGQQQATAIESIFRVWTQLKNGVNTASI